MTLDIPRTPSFRLDGKRALVVGASRGIGLAAAAALAGAGAQVVAAARSKGDLEGFCRELNALGHSSFPVTLDATDSGAVEAVFADHGPFDVVVNSVGTNKLAHLVDVTDEDLDFLLDVNVKAAFYIARAAARTMQEAGISGSIITISSQMGIIGGKDRSVYSATKHALEGMTKSLAWEVGKDGIRVNTICPTFIETALAIPILALPGVREWGVSQIALNRLGRIEEVMGPVLFLASEASSLVTGSAIMLDGGWTAR